MTCRSSSINDNVNGACPPTDLFVDHVTHGHSDLHACPLDVVEVEVMEQGESDGADGEAGRVAQSLVQSRHVFWVVGLKVNNHLPQEHRLDHLDDFLIGRQGDGEG